MAEAVGSDVNVDVEPAVVDSRVAVGAAKVVD